MSEATGYRDILIKDLPISVAAKNAMLKDGVKTLGDVEDLGANVHRIRGVGTQSVMQMRIIIDVGRLGLFTKSNDERREDRLSEIHDVLTSIHDCLHRIEASIGLAREEMTGEDTE